MLIICCGGDLRNDDNDFLVQLCKLTGKLLKVQFFLKKKKILFLISKVLILAIILNGDVRIQLLSNACNYSSIQLDMIFNKIRRLVPFLMFL